VFRHAVVPLLLFVGAPSSPVAQAPNPRVRIVTSLGAIEVEIDSAHAPLTAANFLRYVDRGRFNGGRFHRTVTPDNQPNNAVKIEVIQGGVAPGQQGRDDPPIALERTSVTGLHHRDGTVSMARSRSPDSATSDFFICIGDQPELDFGGKRNPDGQGFAAFGQVIHGMDVVRAIQRSPASGQNLTPPIVIERLERIVP
jgi:peptidyl-prolyl cis-trans isomerase A (cyclophilin A)